MLSWGNVVVGIYKGPLLVLRAISKIHTSALCYYYFFFLNGSTILDDRLLGQERADEVYGRRCVKSKRALAHAVCYLLSCGLLGTTHLAQAFCHYYTAPPVP